MHPKQKVVKNYCKTHKPLKSDGWNMTCPLKIVPFSGDMGGICLSSGGGRMPHPNKAFEGLFFLEEFFEPSKLRWPWAERPCGEKRCRFWKKTRWVNFRLLWFAPWCDFAVVFFNESDANWGYFWHFLAASLRLATADFVGGCFFGRFLEGIFAPKTRGDDSIGRIFSWESKGTHPMDD